MGTKKVIIIRREVSSCNGCVAFKNIEGHFTCGLAYSIRHTSKEVDGVLYSTAPRPESGKCEKPYSKEAFDIAYKRNTEGTIKGRPKPKV